MHATCPFLSPRSTTSQRPGSSLDWMESPSPPSSSTSASEFPDQPACLVTALRLC
ncbi:unnamed protein product, partial [Closterium sp. NIES-54]